MALRKGAEAPLYLNVVGHIMNNGSSKHRALRTIRIGANGARSAKLTRLTSSRSEN